MLKVYRVIEIKNLQEYSGFDVNRNYSSQIVE